ncbi:MAG: YqaJ viral recombinase family protein [Oscillospiraceae bacterium]|nr:YqaJ viral recombinase family protein [Oscillospiraceae bacterium]
MGKITKTPVAGLNHEEWLALRHQSIGGSEIGAILGLNPWQSAYSLWCERTGRTPAFEGNLQTRVGTALEDTVARLFAETSGLEVQRTNFLYTNTDFPHLHALPDRLVRGRRTGLEIKTTSAFNGDQFRGQEFPAQYYAQSVQYMGILEYDEWFIAVLIGNHDLRFYQLVRSEEIQAHDWCSGRLLVEDGEFEALKAAGAAFWECLEKDIPPAVDGSDATTEALNEAYPESGDGMEPMTFFGRESLVSEWFSIKEQMDSLETRKQEIRNILCADMGLYETGVCGEHRITWKTQTRNTFDSKRAVKEHPELASYYRQSSTRVFTIK